MIKAICFDLDGTLVDYKGDFRNWLLQGANKLGVPQHLLERFMEATSKHTRSLADSLEITKAALTDIGMALPERVEQLSQEGARRYAADIHLLAGAKHLLESLRQKNFPLAVITNGPTDMQRAALKKVDIEHYFKAVLVSGELGIRKPDARIFQIACEHLQVQPEHCLMVGDNLTADVDGARSIGMQAVWMSKERVEGVKACSSLRELKEWLEPQLQTNP
jgi:putative hydrolase of the HAD superfamily